MRISIGILAYNESSVIARTIGSALAQSLLVAPPEWVEKIELVCVPNGCTDDTAAVAKRAIEEGMARLPAAASGRATGRVVELARGGKVNAWNEFMSRISDQAADRVIMMDGDIRIDHPDTMLNLIKALDEHPEAVVSTPEFIKHVALKRRKSLLEWLTLLLGATNRARGYGLCGMMYCGRGEFLRRVCFPDGMIGEDAFLHGLIITDLCRSREERYDRVVGAPDARVVFEAYTSIPKLFKAQRRQAVTRGVNAILWDYLWNNVGELDAGELIRRRSAEDPEWFKKLVAERVKEKGWWVMPKGVLLRRLRSLRNLPLGSALATLPWAVVGAVADVVIHVNANSLLKRGRIQGLWQTTQTTKI